jgi:methylated-DNA-[protein]-cysteine S-methyltransferase
MCSALWTRNLERGLPGGTPAPLTAAAPTTAVPSVAGGKQAGLGCAWVAAGTSPFGALHVAATSVGLCMLGLGESAEEFAERLRRAGWRPAGADDAAGAPPAVWELLARAIAQLEEYFAGTRRAFDLPLDLRGTTAFDRRVLEAMAAIPYGETRTYLGLARAIDSPRAARAVGHACGRNPLPLLLPCHRVVRSDGGLAGYGAGGPSVKAALLAHEREGTPC